MRPSILSDTYFLIKLTLWCSGQYCYLIEKSCMCLDCFAVPACLMQSKHIHGIRLTDDSKQAIHNPSED